MKSNNILFPKSGLLLALSLLMAGMLNGCRWLPSAKRVEGTVPEDTAISADANGIFIRPDAIAAIQVIFTDNESLERSMEREDYTRLSGLLRSAVYDSDWNDSGIMVKMVTPEYVLLLSYTNKDQDRPLEELYIWKEGGRVKFRNVWFLLPAGQQPHLYDLIENYRQEDRWTAFTE